MRRWQYLNANYLSDEIKRFAPEPASIVHLHTQYHFGGYAKHTPELLSFIKSFSDNTSIPLESVYTGKLFFAIYDLIQKGYFAPNSRILAVHTGGIFSF